MLIVKRVDITIDVRRKVSVLVFGVVVLLAASLVFIGSTVLAQSPGSAPHVPGRILVKFRSGTPQGVVNAEIQKQNGKVAGRINRIGTLIVHVPEDKLENVIDALSRNPHVEYAEPDFIATVADFPQTAPIDEYYSEKQWGLENTGQYIVNQRGTIDADIDAQDAWNITTGNAVTVAVLDTGIDATHPDLDSKIDLKKDFTGSSTSTEDIYGHGTHVSGIVAAETNTTQGIAGTCPDCRLFIGKVLNDSGSGAYSWIANGIGWATDNGADVINMSLGGSQKSSTLENAVHDAWNNGVVIVAAAGNSSNPSRTYPGAYGNVIAVAATDNRDNKASFSSYGSWVSVAAPGVNIFSTFPTHPFTLGTQNGRAQYYDYGSGTSMATPMAAGVAGLIWASEYGTSNAAVRARLESTADSIAGTGSYWAYGRINAGRAVTQASVTPAPTATPTPTPTPTPATNPSGTISVSSVSYAASGGRYSDKHLSITVAVTNESGSVVSGASVSVELVNSTTNQTWTYSGTTGTNGSFVFSLTNAPSGTYATTITGVIAEGYTWDGHTPPNSFTK